MKVSKIITLIIWAVCAWCLVITDNSIWVITGRALFWVLLVSHLLEFVIYLPKLRKMDGSMPAYFINIMLFGIVYWNEIKPGDNPDSK
jgi:hypothetical protein|tara:strand:- start:106 stop:369 length:264 start_codon:yes stop_codon:yes gene_type:complete